jgi:hypothetical protein
LDDELDTRAPPGGAREKWLNVIYLHYIRETGYGGMSKDDLDKIEKELNNFPGLYQERGKYEKIFDADAVKISLKPKF